MPMLPTTPVLKKNRHHRDERGGKVGGWRGGDELVVHFSARMRYLVRLMFRRQTGVTPNAKHLVRTQKNEWLAGVTFVGTGLPVKIFFLVLGAEVGIHAR